MEKREIHTCRTVLRRLSHNIRLLTAGQGWWILCLLCTLWLTGSTALAANEQKVADLGNLLSTQEEAELQKRLVELSETYECDVLVATTDSFEGKGRWNYTDEFYYENNYGYCDTIDGILLMVNLPEREFQYFTRGKAIEIFTDYGLEVIDEKVTPYLSDGEFADAFMCYADLAEQFLKEAAAGRPYDVNHTYKAKMSMPVRIAVSFGVGAAAAVIVLLVLFGQLRTVRTRGTAQEYIQAGSFRVTGARDLYLYRNVSRRKIERNRGGGGSSTRSSSGGGRAGGRGGSF